ncbi:hypothetical protein CF060_01510 [Clostridium botulinum]|uniref:hypothetical protein n=1 Tax=Clostridium botulinum TaxID=1491 RepID=UPI000C75F920|nr:hypothetical protein [Clostridium botulinum]AUM99405.1 hypothetical protein RSJ13_10465 [Clostridium botulinum]
MQKLKKNKAKFNNAEVTKEKSIRKVKEIEKLLKDREDILKESNQKFFNKMVEKVNKFGGNWVCL